jgi:hypothetical protein
MHSSSEALKARNSEAELNHFAPSALRSSLLYLPGPLAQAFTFRAFGAGAVSIWLIVVCGCTGGRDIAGYRWRGSAAANADHAQDRLRQGY